MEAVPEATILKDEPNDHIASLEVAISTESDEPVLDDTVERTKNIFQGFLSTVSQLIQSIRKRTN